MPTEQLIPVPEALNSPQQVQIAGKNAWATLSPFDFPRFAQVMMRDYDDKTRIAVRFMYDVANDEAVDDSIKRPGVALGIGKESGRVFSITVTLKPKADAARALSPWVSRLHECFVDLRNRTIKNPTSYLVRRNAHYKIVESFVPVMAKQIDEHAASAAG